MPQIPGKQTISLEALGIGSAAAQLQTEKKIPYLVGCSWVSVASVAAPSPGGRRGLHGGALGIPCNTCVIPCYYMVLHLVFYVVDLQGVSLVHEVLPHTAPGVSHILIVFIVFFIFFLVVILKHFNQLEDGKRISKIFCFFIFRQSRKLLQSIPYLTPISSFWIQFQNRFKEVHVNFVKLIF